MRLGLEERHVRVESGAEVGEVVGEVPAVVEEEAVALSPAGGFFTARIDACDEVLVDRFDDRVGADVGAVDVQPRVRLARRRQAHALEHPHREALPEAGRVLNKVVEHERFEPEEALVAHVAIEVDAEARLTHVAAGVAARADAGVADVDAVPGHVGRIVGVLEIPVAEPRPVIAVKRQVQLVQDGRVEQLAGAPARRPGWPAAPRAPAWSRWQGVEWAPT